jgi:hypothetical protein
MKPTSSTRSRAARPQQSGLAFQVRPTPSGNATTKPPRSASAFQLYDCWACRPVPTAPCRTITSGTAVPAGTAGR